MVQYGVAVLQRDQHRHFSYGGHHGIGLLKLVATIAIVLDHLPDAAHLAFYPCKSCNDRLSLFGVPSQVEPPVPELLFHCAPYSTGVYWTPVEVDTLQMPTSSRLRWCLARLL